MSVIDKSVREGGSLYLSSFNNPQAVTPKRDGHIMTLFHALADLQNVCFEISLLAVTDVPFFFLQPHVRKVLCPVVEAILSGLPRVEQTLGSLAEKLGITIPVFV